MRKKERTELVQKVIEIILTCKDEDFSFITAGWLARKVNTSPANLSRAFKLENGRTLQSYLIQQKLSRSAFLMDRKQDIKVKETAAALDYRSTSHFISVFKKRFGVSPRMYHCCKHWKKGIKKRRGRSFLI
jgi:AraC-like DNA-binding protein